MEKLEPLCVAGGNQKGTAGWKTAKLPKKKVKYRFPI
jgi:hypothetical protein